uniref:Uncharacterized protein n=1 Tax=Megaselia scalaris TaxID=36166 RepID=T1GHM8_MEGSC
MSFSQVARSLSKSANLFRSGRILAGTVRPQIRMISQSFAPVSYTITSNKNFQSLRLYSSEGGKKPSLVEITERVLKVVAAYDKVTSSNNQVSLWQLQSTRLYSGKPPLNLKLIEERVVLVLNLYDKIDPAKLLNLHT